jgi:hypothetical protein
MPTHKARNSTTGVAIYWMATHGWNLSLPSRLLDLPETGLQVSHLLWGWQSYLNLGKMVLVLKNCNAQPGRQYKFAFITMNKVGKG